MTMDYNGTNMDVNGWPCTTVDDHGMNLHNDGMTMAPPCMTMALPFTTMGYHGMTMVLRHVYHGSTMHDHGKTMS